MIINIQLYDAIIEAHRPKVSFHNEPVEKIETKDHAHYTIITPTMVHERDFFTTLEIDPIQLDGCQKMTYGELSAQVKDTTCIYEADAILGGETFPAIILSGNGKLFAMIVTDEGPVVFAILM